jgi:hypothetical protein
MRKLVIILTLALVATLFTGPPASAYTAKGHGVGRDLTRVSPAGCGTRGLAYDRDWNYYSLANITTKVSARLRPTSDPCYVFYGWSKGDDYGVYPVTGMMGRCWTLGSSMNGNSYWYKVRTRTHGPNTPIIWAWFPGYAVSPSNLSSLVPACPSTG